MIKAFLPDGDDTLFDSERFAGRYGALPTMVAFQREDGKLELPEGQLRCWKTGEMITHDQYLTTTAGHTMKQMLQGARERLNLDVSDAVIDHRDIDESLRVTDYFRDNLKPMPGARELLARMRQIELVRSIYVVSSSTLYRINVSLEATRMRELVDGAFSAQGDGYYRNGKGPQIWTPGPNFHSVHAHRGRPLPKPDPCVYEIACWELGIHPSEAATVEDSESGNRAANLAGIGLIIGFAHGPEETLAEKERKLLAAGAHVVVRQLDDVIDIMHRHNQNHP